MGGDVRVRWKCASLRFWLYGVLCDEKGGRSREEGEIESDEKLLSMACGGAAH